MSFPNYDITERDGRYFVLHFSKSGDVEAEAGPFFTRNAAERRLADLNATATPQNTFGRFLDGYLRRTGPGQGQ